jgi:hypothetical protein
MELSAETLAAAARVYDRLTGGLLSAQIETSPPPEGEEFGDYPFAWSVARLRAKIGTPGWNWRFQNEDAMAAMHVMAFQNFFASWGRQPMLERLAAPLALPGRFLRVIAAFAAARLMADDGNQVGFSLASAARGEVGLAFSSPVGQPLSIALLAPEPLQWRQRERWRPEVLRAAVAEALAVALPRVNTRTPGIVVLSASILLPGFELALAEAIQATLASLGRRYRGVAAAVMLMPKVRPTERPDEVGFGYTYVPIRNPQFRGSNPVMAAATPG